MTVNPGYPNYEEVARAKRSATGAVGLGQAVPADHARVLLGALAHCETTIDEYASLIIHLTDFLGEGLSAEESRARYLDGWSNPVMEARS